MIRFLIRRVVFGVFVLWLVSLGTFLLFFVVPGDPARSIAGRQATPETIALIRERLGLDEPLAVQYWTFLKNLFRGDLGYSYYNNQPVTALIAERIGPTASLVIGGALLWLVIGVGVGILSATHARSLLDRVTAGFVVAGISMPTFVVGLMLLFVFNYLLSTVLGITFFPGGQYTPLEEDPADWLRHMILPWITLCTVQAAIYTRLTRGSLLEVLGEDYIRTARAKGDGNRRVVVVHGLRAALTPVVTQLGVDVGYMLGGVVVTESVFGLGGVGQAALQAIVNLDRPVVMGVVLLAAFFVVLASIVVDIAYSFLDPRVRLS
ncbi:MAG: ABC transporter permease subunit [Streptosporangiales bacterium]|nr:ABC transporter permease subunit [Streptosporangiales bacterium]